MMMKSDDDDVDDDVVEEQMWLRWYPPGLGSSYSLAQTYPGLAGQI